MFTRLQSSGSVCSSGWKITVIRTQYHQEEVIQALFFRRERRLRSQRPVALDFVPWQTHSSLMQNECTGTHGERESYKACTFWKLCVCVWVGGMPGYCSVFKICMLITWISSKHGNDNSPCLWFWHWKRPLRRCEMQQQRNRGFAGRPKLSSFLQTT